MNFYRWFFNNDTPRWKRNTFGFLLAVTISILVALVVWAVWSLLLSS